MYQNVAYRSVWETLQGLTKPKLSLHHHGTYDFILHPYLSRHTTFRTTTIMLSATHHRTSWWVNSLHYHTTAFSNHSNLHCVCSNHDATLVRENESMGHGGNETKIHRPSTMKSPHRRPVHISTIQPIRLCLCHQLESTANLIFPALQCHRKGVIQWWLHMAFGTRVVEWRN